MLFITVHDIYILNTTRILQYKHILAIFTTTSITLSSNKAENGDILEPGNLGPPGKWPNVKQRERDRWRICSLYHAYNMEKCLLY